MSFDIVAEKVRDDWFLPLKLPLQRSTISASKHMSTQITAFVGEVNGYFFV
ncbi:hypothetical protein [Sulfitobacter sp. PS-8MA]|uniref:hypothetical protein n=1 Tax=Sulfitobacter sp. PS-8MA TaxID=3237707 RepID=UPI0034C61409